MSATTGLAVILASTVTPLKDEVEAGRRLMAKKADWVGADMEVSVDIRSALEWRPEGLDLDWLCALLRITGSIGRQPRDGAERLVGAAASRIPALEPFHLH